MRFYSVLFAAMIALTASQSWADDAPATQPYKVINSAKVGGDGGFDYVYAEADGRKLYIPRGNRVDVFDLDTLKPAGTIADTKGVHGVAVDPKTGHGFTSSGPVVMFDSKTLATIKTIDVAGHPDGIYFDAATSHIYVLSHSAPNVTVLNSTDGAIVGTIDLGGAPEEAAGDGNGHVYIDIEDGDKVAVVDANTLKMTGSYPLGDKGGGPAGLAMDAKNHILFVFCHDPHNAVIMNADDGKIIATLPIGDGVDAGEFNPATMEAFSSQRDGTLTVIKENSPTSFEVEQNVQTKAGAKTSTLDSKTNQIYLITAERAAAPAPAAGGAAVDAPAPGARRRGGATVPGSFTILVVGK